MLRFLKRCFHMLDSIKRLLIKPFANEKVSKVIDYIAVILIFYCQTDALLFSLNDKMRIFEFLILFVVFLVLLCKYLSNKHILSIFYSKAFLIATLLSLIVVFSLLVNVNNIFNIHRYFFTIINLYLSVIIVLTINFKPFLKAFLFVLLIFSLSSFFIYLIYVIKPTFFSFMPVIKNTAGYDFNFCFVSSVLVKDRAGLHSRNYGIFREPGVFAVFLLFAIIISLFKGDTLFVKKRSSFVASCVFSVTLLSTKSTTGIFCFAIILVLFFFYKVKKNSLFFWIGLLAIIVLFVFSVYCVAAKPAFVRNIEFLNLVYGKIDFNNISFVSRFFDQFATLLCALQNPLTGLGWGNHYSFITKLAAAYNYSTNGGTNTLFLLFSVYGSIFGVIYVYIAYNAFSKINLHGITTGLLFLVLLIAIFCEDLTNSLFIYLLPMLGYFSIERRLARHDFEEIFI